MNTKVIEYEDENMTAHIVVSEATVLIGMKRTRIRLEAEPEKEEDPDKRLLRLFTYPDLAAAATEIMLTPAAATDGEKPDEVFISPSPPLDFETFLALPEQLVSAWEQAVYALNPHWLPGNDSATKKKATISTGG